MKIIALYVRVSTKKQDTQMQIIDSVRFINRTYPGYAIKLYKESPVSSASLKRPALKTMLKDARNGVFQGIVIWKLDRMYRSLSNFATLLNEIKSLGIDFRSVTDSFDVKSPQGMLMVHLLASIAEYERELIRERTRAAIAYRRAQGKQVGRKLSKPEVTATDIQQWEKTGLSIRAIAAKTGMSKSAVARRKLGG